MTKIKDYTMHDEKNSLEKFLREQNIVFNHNYLRMEKGPRPLLYRLITLSHQIRFRILDFQHLLFTENRLIILTKDKDDTFNSDNMVSIKHDDIHDFSFQKKYGDYCVYFNYSKEDYYFYLSDRITHKALDKVFRLRKRNYSHENLSYLKELNFMGLLKEDK